MSGIEILGACIGILLTIGLVIIDTIHKYKQGKLEKIVARNPNSLEKVSVEIEGVDWLFTNTYAFADRHNIECKIACIDNKNR